MNLSKPLSTSVNQLAAKLKVESQQKELNAKQEELQAEHSKIHHAQQEIQSEQTHLQHQRIVLEDRLQEVKNEIV